jgi:hypothetical protein
VAHIETWYRCPTCQTRYGKQSEAIECRNKHPVKSEKWAVGKGGKAVRIFDNWGLDSMHGVNGALREADLSDDIEERKRQLEGEKLKR